MKRTASLVVLVALVAVFAGSAGAVTKPKAFKAARACLLASSAHARFVGHGPDGGGFVSFRGGSAFWTYHTTRSQVSSVAVRFAGRPGLSKRTKAILRGCLWRGI